MDKVCITGLDCGAKWTTERPPFKLIVILHSNEAITIVNAFKSKDITPCMTNDIYADGMKYTLLREKNKIIVFTESSKKC